MDNRQVLIADSFDVYRQGLKSIISTARGFEVVDSVVTGKELISAFKKNPDAICLTSSNISDYNIHELLLKLKKIREDVSVIVLTYSTDISHLNQSLKAGVKGYLTKNTRSQEIIRALKKVAKGENAYSKSVSQQMIGKYTDLAKKTGPGSKNGITKREKEILQLIVDGYTSSEIAKLLFISPRTVETHRANLMNKFKLKNTAALVRFALEQENLP